MQPPRHPETHLAALAIFLLGTVAGCCSSHEDTAPAEDEDPQAEGSPSTESLFIAEHSAALCERETEIFLDRPEGEDDPYKYTVDSRCENVLQAHYYEVVRGLFVTEIAEACHVAYLDAQAPAPFGELDWRWCFFAWTTA